MTNPIITVREHCTVIEHYNQLAIYAEQIDEKGQIDPRYIGSVKCVDKYYNDAFIPASIFSVLGIGIPFLIVLLIKKYIEQTKITLNGRAFRIKKSNYKKFLQISGLKEKPIGKLSHLNLHQLIKDKMASSPNHFAKAQDASYFTTDNGKLIEDIYAHNISSIKNDIRKGANVNAEIALKQHIKEEIFLVSKGTPLGYACHWNDKPLVQWLLAYGASTKPTFKTYTNQGSIATEYKVDTPNSTLIPVE